MHDVCGTVALMAEYVLILLCGMLSFNLQVGLQLLAEGVFGVTNVLGPYMTPEDGSNLVPHPWPAKFGIQPYSSFLFKGSCY